LPCPLYCPDLTPSDYRLFGDVKNNLQGHHDTSYEALQNAVHQWLQRAGRETVIGWEYVLLFKAGRRLSTKRETAL
jgi:hypothetical protein